MFPILQMSNGHLDSKFDTCELFEKALAKWRFQNNENFAPNVSKAPMSVEKCFAEQTCMGLPAYAMHLVPLEVALMSSHMIYYKLQIFETFADEIIE